MITMKRMFAGAVFAAFGIGLATAPAAAAPLGGAAGKAAAAVATQAGAGASEIRFSKRVCDAWRHQARGGNKLARRLYQSNCRGRNDRERAQHWRRQCNEWSRHRNRGQRYHAQFREHCHGRKWR